MADEKYLRITPLSYTVPSDGGTVEIYIESNVE